MSGIFLEIRLDGFENYPIRMSDAELVRRESALSAPIDLSTVAASEGAHLEAYLDELKVVLSRSHFHIQDRLVVRGVAPPSVRCDLSRIRWVDVDFRQTDFEGSSVSQGLWMENCLIDDSLPPIQIGPGEVLRYPPAKAAKELRLDDPRDLIVLRWGLSQDARHVGAAFLWLERRNPNPNTEIILTRLLKGLPPRPQRRLKWSP